MKYTDFSIGVIVERHGDVGIVTSVEDFDSGFIGVLFCGCEAVVPTLIFNTELVRKAKKDKEIKYIPRR